MLKFTSVKTNDYITKKYGQNAGNYRMSNKFHHFGSVTETCKNKTGEQQRFHHHLKFRKAFLVTNYKQVSIRFKSIGIMFVFLYLA